MQAPAVSTRPVFICRHETRSVRGFHGHHWVRDRMSFWAVSDLDDTGHAEFVHALRASRKTPAGLRAARFGQTLARLRVLSPRNLANVGRSSRTAGDPVAQFMIEPA